MIRPLLPCMAVALLVSALPACDGTAVSAEAPTSGIGNALLLIEQSRADCRDLPAGAVEAAIAEATRPDRGVGVDAPSTAVINQLRLSARATPAMVDQALATVASQGGMIDARAFGAAAARFHRIDGTTTDTGEPTVVLLARRADRDPIERLATLMIRPEQAGERQLAAIRAQWALSAAVEAGPGRLRQTDRETIERGIDQFFVASRQAPDEWNNRLVPVRMMTDQVRQHVERTLAVMPPADVQALLSEYDSPAGRARRQAVSTAFRAAADRAMRATLADFLEKAGATG